MKVYRTLMFVSMLILAMSCGGGEEETMEDVTGGVPAKCGTPVDLEKETTECNNKEDIEAIREELGTNAYHFPYITTTDVENSGLTLEEIGECGYIWFSRNRYCQPDVIVVNGVEIKVRDAYFIVEHCDSVDWDCVHYADIVAEFGEDVRIPLSIEYALPIEGTQQSYNIWPTRRDEGETLDSDVSMYYPWYPIFLKNE